MSATIKKPWYKSVPDPMVLLFVILIVVFIMAYFIPAGAYERISENGRMEIVPDSFHFIADKPHLKIFDIFVAIPKGLIAAAPYLFITFIAGALFHILHKSGALENSIGVVVHKIGVKNKNIIIILSTYLYGFFGIAVGYENNIALVPMAVMISAALGCSRLVGAAMSVGGIGVGFALSPINPFTIGVSQQIAQLPLFSGAWLRIILVISALGLLSFYICKFVTKIPYQTDEDDNILSKNIGEYHLSLQDKLTLFAFCIGIAIMLFGVFTKGWYINQIAAMFIIMAIIIGIINRLSANEIVHEMMIGASKVTAGALVIGVAASIQVLLKDANIIDTIVYYLGSFIQDIPLSASAVVTSVLQGIINFFIPSGSGQALANMPILIPLADLIGMSRQLMILSFQIGDGITNLIIPTSGGMLAMIALTGVSYEKWLRVILPYVLFLYLLCWVALIIGQNVGY